MNNSLDLNASAIFVDLENMVGGEHGARFDISQVMNRVGKRGIPVLRKAYGNWGRYAPYRHDFINQAFDQVQLFNVTEVKNGLDIQMSVDALEAIFLFPHIKTIFLLSGDSDFCPLVRILRKHGRQVIGIGWLASTSKALREHCDEFWPYDELAGISTIERKSITSKALKYLISQVATELGPGEWVKMSTLKDAILRRDPAFDEKQYGYSSFSQFVDAYPDLQAKFSERFSDYLVRLPGGESTGTNGTENTSHLDQIHKSDEQRFLACIRKRNMQFLGPELQGRVLRAIYEVITTATVPPTRQEILSQATSGPLESFVKAGELSRNKVAGVFQIIYSARCFDLIPGDENIPTRMDLLPDFETYDLLKQAHDVQLIRTGLACGIDLPVERWAELLLGHDAQTTTMKEIFAELQMLEVS